MTPTRRQYLAAVAGTATVVGAGCAATDTSPNYTAGTVDEAPAEDERTPEEMAAAEALAQREVDGNVGVKDGLELRDHEYRLEDDYRGPTVQGTVENASDDHLETVEVRVRTYDDGDDQLGRYVDRTGDLGPDERWRFEVILLDSPADIASYDIAVLGT